LFSQEFDEQMEYLYYSGYTSISPDELLDYIQFNKPLPDKAVLITFDDGYRDTYVHAYPILKKYNFSATVFLITDYVGTNNNYLDWNQIKEMYNHGFVFGSHTLNHIELINTTEEYAEYQLAKSREAIMWRLNDPVNYFAYPEGFYNKAIIKLVQDIGYRAAFTVNFGRDKRDSNVFALNRIPIFKSFHPLYSFILRLQLTQLLIEVSMLRSYLNNPLL
jgi:peptidoglycan/xylan/chitin deacetylase (PgdA/CDA1 family)